MLIEFPHILYDTMTRQLKLVSSPGFTVKLRGACMISGCEITNKTSSQKQLINLIMHYQ